MNIEQLRRDKEKVLASLVTVNGQVITKTGCNIHIPRVFEDMGLIKLGAEIFVLGMLAVTINDTTVADMNVPALIKISPTSFNTYVHNETEYYDFFFEPGSVVFASTTIVMDDTMVYWVYQIFAKKVIIPWYKEYHSVSLAYANSKKYTGVEVGATPQAYEIVSVFVARDPDDLTKQYRYVPLEKRTKPPVYISVSSVSYGATNTMAKLIGSRFEEGVQSALLNPSVRSEKIEDMLR